MQKTSETRPVNTNLTREQMTEMLRAAGRLNTLWDDPGNLEPLTNDELRNLRKSLPIKSSVKDYLDEQRGRH